MEHTKGMDNTTHEEFLAEPKSAAIEEPASVRHLEDEPAPHLHSKTFLVVGVSQSHFSTTS